MASKVNFYTIAFENDNGETIGLSPISFLNKLESMATRLIDVDGYKVKHFRYARVSPSR